MAPKTPLEQVIAPRLFLKWSLLLPHQVTDLTSDRKFLKMVDLTGSTLWFASLSRLHISDAGSTIRSRLAHRTAIRGKRHLKSHKLSEQIIGRRH